MKYTLPALPEVSILDSCHASLAHVFYSYSLWRNFSRKLDNLTRKQLHPPLKIYLYCLAAQFQSQFLLVVGVVVVVVLLILEFQSEPEVFLHELQLD